MTEKLALTPAIVDDIEDAIAFALRFDGRNRAHTGDEFMARLTAQRLVAHLERCGFVVMKKPQAKPHTTWDGPARPNEGPTT